ncbi:MAG: glycosyltransferase family A protein [Terriglobales bacterium]
MKITVILCSYNRCQLLAEALESVAASTLPESVEWEVLVVDNNSTDRTREVVEDFRHRYPGRFRYVFEPRPGKSFALNTGVREAHGDVLAFTDDDVTVEATWMQNLTACLSDGEWAGAGGRTLLAHPFSPPRWLTLTGPDNLGYVLAPLFDHGLQPFELREAPYGANMAFRKAMLEKYGGFRADLGPKPGSEIRNEDTEFGRRLIAAGERLRYEPAAIVYHPVVENRVRKDYFLSWCFDHGRAVVREWPSGTYVFGIPRRALTFFKFVGTFLPVRIIQWAVTLNPRRRFRRKCWVWATVGQIVEIRRQWYSTRLETIDREESPKSGNQRHSMHI